MSCQVCSSPAEGEIHYGATSCRACAAFFRRYYNSKKTKILCRCQTRQRNSHPCRECRVKRCLDAGMNPQKVQLQRDGNKNQRILPPIERIISREVSNISHSVAKWLKIQPTRERLLNSTFGNFSFYDSCRVSTEDVSLMWNLVAPIFQQVRFISARDRRSLISNFLPKWPLFVFAVEFAENDAFNGDNIGEEEQIRNIINLYSWAIPDSPDKATEDKLAQVFLPFFHQYTNNVSIPIGQKEFDTVEFMALTLLLIFDGAHSNLSSKCSEMCHQIRKVIMRELKGYNEDRKADEMRFIETIDTLPVMERAVENFHKELLMCEMYNVQIHNDFRMLIKENNC